MRPADPGLRGARRTVPVLAMALFGRALASWRGEPRFAAKRLDCVESW
ncbi:hypothetical protein BIWAKO_00275 [Bosea sp. BIWAKO-01]|nr:hypothetical protein BIWAKO_00275 [Bosea sp. BIWAKO-01]